MWAVSYPGSLELTGPPIKPNPPAYVVGRNMEPRRGVQYGAVGQVFKGMLGAVGGDLPGVLRTILAPGKAAGAVDEREAVRDVSWASGSLVWASLAGRQVTHLFF